MDSALSKAFELLVEEDVVELVSDDNNVALLCKLEICMRNGPFAKKLLNWSPLDPD